MLDQGHDGDLENVLADTLANEGCAVEFPVDRDFMPSEWDAEEFTNVLAESDLNQAIPVHELLGAHVKRLKQLERLKRREAKAQHTTQPGEGTATSPFLHVRRHHFGGVRGCHKFGRRHVVRPVRLPPEDELLGVDA